VGGWPDPLRAGGALIEDEFTVPRSKVIDYTQTTTREAVFDYLISAFWGLRCRV